RHVVRVADEDRDFGDVGDFGAAGGERLGQVRHHHLGHRERRPCRRSPGPTPRASRSRFQITPTWASKSSGGSTLPSTSAPTWPAQNTSFCAPSAVTTLLALAKSPR